MIAGQSAAGADSQYKKVSMSSVENVDKKEIITKYVERCFSDLMFFAQEFLPHLLTEDVPEFHAEMYSLIPDNKRLAIAAPRGFAKSTISSVIYPIWLAVSGIRAKDIVIISASEGLAVELLRKVKRELEGNQKLIQYFGELYTDKWSENHIIVKGNINIRARGAGGQIRGFRPDCLILDDIETDELVESEDQRKKLKDWLFKACLNTLMPNGQFIIVGTILTNLSLLNEILTSDNDWEKRKYRAYFDGVQQPGYELWPSLWTHERLQKRKKEIGSFAFAAEYMNDPMSDESSPIKENQIRYWTDLPDLSYVIAVDPAYKEDEKADYKVASLIGIDTQMNRYLVSYVRTHASLGEFIDSILNLWMQHRDRITAVGIPAGSEEQFYKSVVEKANNRRIYPPFTELKNVFSDASGVAHRKKKNRIVAALQPLFESGKYFINKAHVEAKEELLTIGSSRWDDLVDSLAYAEQIIQPVFIQQGKKKFDEPVYSSRPNYGFED